MSNGELEHQHGEAFINRGLLKKGGDSTRNSDQSSNKSDLLPATLAVMAAATALAALSDERFKLVLDRLTFKAHLAAVDAATVVSVQAPFEMQRVGAFIAVHLPHINL